MNGRKRPQILDKPLPMYDNEWSELPDRVRISFDNGRTAVYDLRMEQPHPVILENIRIIRKWRGYVNQPMRRRRKP